MITDFAKLVKISEDDILGRKRDSEISDARHLYWYFLKEKAGFSLSEIARMNDRNHSTVHYGINRMNDLISNGDIRICSWWKKVRDMEV